MTASLFFYWMRATESGPSDLVLRANGLSGPRYVTAIKLAARLDVRCAVDVPLECFLNVYAANLDPLYSLH